MKQNQNVVEAASNSSNRYITKIQTSPGSTNFIWNFHWYVELFNI